MPDQRKEALLRLDFWRVTGPCSEDQTRSQALAPPVCRFEMHDHPRPHGFGGLSPNGKADTAAEDAPGDNRPQFVASKLKTVNVGTRYGSADDFVAHG